MSAPRRLTPGFLTALAVVAAVGPIAIDFYLPSFTDIADDLDASASAVQLTLTGFLLGVAAGQLLLGPLSDRVGRRPVLVTGFAVFALASIVNAFAPTIEVFVALRIVQGFSGAAGMVLARTIVVDLAGPGRAVRPLSLIMTMVALGPIIAPPIGALLAAAWGWRGTLAVMAALAVAMFLLALWVVPESLPPERRSKGGMGAVAKSLAVLLAEPGFRGYLIAFALGFAGFMAYLSASPFVAGKVLGLGPVLYAMTFAFGGAGIIVAMLVNAWIALRFGPARMFTVGQGMALSSGLLFLVLSLTETLRVWSFVPLVFALCAGMGLIMSNGTALALARADAARGAGSALLGAAQFLAGAVISPLVGLWGESTAVPMAVIIVLSIGAGMMAAALARRAGPPE